MEDKYIVFDTEFTAWQGSQERNWSLPNEYKELVQISAIKVNKGEIEEILDLYIKPKKNPILSDYFINLTGITNDDLKEKGISFEDGIEKFYKFSKNYNLYSYGPDWKIINENLNLYNFNKSSKFFDKDWTSQFFDFRDKLKCYDIDTSKYTSGTIYKAFNLKLENHHVHNSFDDAYSLYIVSKKL